MNISEMASVLNRAYPMLLLDGVTSLEARVQCHAYKNVTYNEWFFPAHFPTRPVLPGSLQIEAFSQAVALPLLVGSDSSDGADIPLLLAGVDKVRLYRPVVPGDRFEISAKIERITMGVATATATGYVDNEIVSECRIVYKIVREQ